MKIKNNKNLKMGNSECQKCLTAETEMFAEILMNLNIHRKIFYFQNLIILHLLAYLSFI